MIIAQDKWGDTLPDWVRTLVKECDESSQNQVARKLGISSTVVSQVIHNNYPGNLENIAGRVSDVFEQKEIECPALGLIQGEACLQWRDQMGTTSSVPIRVQMDRACRCCPRGQKGSESET
ncbi:helix-turn-helix transcriptional regulator [Rhodobacteraceae bacterium M382]|nr:helix-turn-helix transcriptional regulator [Rhodobacteraceae bacterium M382]